MHIYLFLIRYVVRRPILCSTRPLCDDAAQRRHRNVVGSGEAEIRSCLHSARVSVGRHFRECAGHRWHFQKDAQRDQTKTNVSFTKISTFQECNIDSLIHLLIFH